MKYLLLFCAVCLIFAACNDKKRLDCTPSILEKYEMVPYTGTEQIGCMYIEKYEWEGQFYFREDGYCVDMAGIVEDCYGNIICEEYGNSQCMNFFKRSTYIGIVGYEQ